MFVIGASFVEKAKQFFTVAVLGKRPVIYSGKRFTDISAAVTEYLLGHFLDLVELAVASRVCKLWYRCGENYLHKDLFMGLLKTVPHSYRQAFRVNKALLQSLRIPTPRFEIHIDGNTIDIEFQQRSYCIALSVKITGSFLRTHWQMPPLELPPYIVENAELQFSFYSHEHSFIEIRTYDRDCRPRSGHRNFDPSEISGKIANNKTFNFSFNPYGDLIVPHALTHPQFSFSSILARKPTREIVEDRLVLRI